jgi:hypothetical protein
MKTGPKPRPLADRFWKKVDTKNGKTPTHMPHIGHCWEWKASCHRTGYGKIGVGSLTDHTHRWVFAHRASWFINNGEWPNLHVLHKCDNPKCVRPEHLFLGTDLDNTRDMIDKRRRVVLCGENSGRVTLTEFQAKEIIRRRKAGENQTKMAREFGICQGQIYRIGRSQWKHLATGGIT